MVSGQREGTGVAPILATLGTGVTRHTCVDVRACTHGGPVRRRSPSQVHLPQQRALFATAGR